MADNLNNSPQVRSMGYLTTKQAARCESMGQTAAQESPFVWCLMGEDAGQLLDEIIVRKEAERRTGGTFWWGLGTPLGSRVESAAILNGGDLPALFSAKPAKVLGRRTTVQLRRSLSIYGMDGAASGLDRAGSFPNTFSSSAASPTAITTH
jgi:hypothetical protein